MVYLYKLTNVFILPIHTLQGDIATCAGTHLFYWSINGELIADINTETGMNQQIYCVAMSQVMFICEVPG